ncbi:Probable siderophore transport system permease protein yfhA [Nocardia otitidiscaviarum]|uniref:Probable siderophore transport system permease protein yfhA n=1 Tax=Nocardia otitidiscaviarum TaxID=1823 RepID=A0A379JKU4_9NOCA|nr:iron chelate uptake ABC transporter family permease subunit [Nocardia otitidiscaviarum]SUD48976.1 Probable siderophore transport system permease protein yfhA [Nocardia otitidiscaviarum]
MTPIRSAVLPLGTVLLRSPGGRIVVRAHRHSALLTVVFTVAALVVAAWSLTVGHFPLTVGDVLRVLGGGGTLIEYDVVVRDRLPRVLTGLCVGAAFAVSGAILQRVATNPLVSPEIIGINTGASLGALVVSVVLGGSGPLLVGGALAGSLLAMAIIVAVATRNGLDGYRLVLVGIGVTAMLSAAISFVLTRANIYEAHTAARWLTGSLANRDWSHVALGVAALAVVTPPLLVLARTLRLLELGDELAATLSGRRGPHRTTLIVLAAVAATLATAAAGPVAFVALVAPQIVRRLLAERDAGLVPAAAAGALLVVTADLAARRLFPAELPVGVVTAVLGAPVLVYLLARATRIGHAG